MPYIFVEEIEEGQQEADVVEKDIVDAVASERDQLKTTLDEVTKERDELVTERDDLKSELTNTKVKYADAFMSQLKDPKERKPEPPKEHKVSSFDELFG